MGSVKRLLRLWAFIKTHCKLVRLPQIIPRESSAPGGQGNGSSGRDASYCHNMNEHQPQKVDRRENCD